jgi:hypothetical protein
LVTRASSGLAVRVVHLVTPPPPRIVPPRTFDAFGWCASDRIEWRRPSQGWDDPSPIDGSDPARMVFVMRKPCNFLPCELARLHAFGLGLSTENALAPWGIDAATDELYARREHPGALFWLAADNLNALFWGLHDWVHFHNHGSFDAPAWTELQCDATALAWLWLNRERAQIPEDVWEHTRRAVVTLSLARFRAEGLPFNSKALDAERLQTLMETR